MRTSARADEETTRRIDELAEALHGEAALVRDLRDSLVRQRGAIAAGDPDAINGSVDEIGRILLTLEQARVQRTRIVGMLAGMAPPPIERLEEILGNNVPPRLETERAALRLAAHEVAREAAINSTVIARAIETGEAFLQAIFSSAADPEPGYATSARKIVPGESFGIFCNRRA